MYTTYPVFADVYHFRLVHTFVLRLVLDVIEKPRERWYVVTHSLRCVLRRSLTRNVSGMLGKDRTIKT